MSRWFSAIILMCCFGCQGMSDAGLSSPSSSPAPPETLSSTPPADSSTVSAAEVISVEVSGEPGQYTFSVTVQSPDTGCEQYADWWEVITDDEELIHRRILLHSHVSEQPFTRSSGPVDLQSEQQVIVRAHLSTTGYGTQAMIGSVESGFQSTTFPIDFALDLANEAPLPRACNF